VLDYIHTYTIMLVIIYEYNRNVLLECKDHISVMFSTKGLISFCLLKVMFVGFPYIVLHSSWYRIIKLHVTIKWVVPCLMSARSWNQMSAWRWQSGLRFIMVFLSLFMQMLGYYLKFSHDTFQMCSISLFTNCPVWYSESELLRVLNKIKYLPKSNCNEWISE
jgi:hypothetical protein